MFYEMPTTSMVTTHADIWSIISVLVALCAGIVLYFTFLNPRNAENYTGATKKLYDFLSFKTMSLEAILKICYLVTAIYITISSFSYISTSFVLFLIVIFLGNIIARVIYEGAILILMIYHKLNEINNKLTPIKEDKKKQEIKKEEKKIEVRLKENK